MVEIAGEAKGGGGREETRVEWTPVGLAAEGERV